jgi:hypothetical protein
MKTPKPLSAVAAVLLLAAVAVGWHNPGHDKATRAASPAVADRLPQFFSVGTDTIAHCSLDPDAFRRPIAPDELHAAEAPEHYFDMELLEGEDPPPDRHAFIALCANKKLVVSKIGLLPYTVTEWTQRLSVAFAEHRASPKDKNIHTKCLVYAGLLAHYAQDLCNPLHTTIHYDGRANKDKSSPRTGIHLKLDALLGKSQTTPADIARNLPPRRFEKLFTGVMAELKRSHALVDEVYQLEGEFPALEDPIKSGSEVAKFAKERLHTAGRFTASLYITAWENSKDIKLPEWHKRQRERIAERKEPPPEPRRAGTPPPARSGPGR